MDYKQWFEKHSTQINLNKCGYAPQLEEMSADEYREYLIRWKALPSTIPDMREEERYQAFKARLAAEQ